MNINNNLLSVIIPVYNGAGIIRSTLDSVARQKNVDCEIIVVDDCSSDNTLAILDAWSSEHRELPMRVIAKNRRELTLKARISGIENASGSDIIFVDADDQLLHTDSIAKILAVKHEGSYDIAHFRSQFRSKVFRGEALWNKPLGNSPLLGSGVFATYAEQRFLPVLAWGKIYSASLLKKILPLVKKISIERLEDILFVSLAMLFAESYCPCNEFGYLYNVSYYWPISKFSARVQDLIRMRPFFENVLHEKRVAEKSHQDFMDFLERRLIFNMNGFCEKFVENLNDGELDDNFVTELLASSQERDGVSLLLTTLIRACGSTLQRMEKEEERLSDGSDIRPHN